MKIKLQDYSLISNEWIDKEIEKLNVIARDGDINKFRIEGQIISLLSIKQQLIPSEKLAEISFNNGYHKGYNVGQKDFESHPLALTIANHIHQDRQEYLKSEIEIL
jgi:hypothetical protein